jgi:predicted permease
MTDLRFAFRQLRKSPGFTGVAVLTLAVGIGANTALFSFLNAFLFRSLMMDQPDQILALYNGDRKNPEGWRGFSYPDYLAVRSETNSFSGVLAQRITVAALTEGAGTRKGVVTLVSPNYFDVLGVRVEKGRAFTPEEDASFLSVAVVSHPYWERTGFDPELLGKTIMVNARWFTVVGIAPKGFTGLTAMFCPEMWLPLGAHEAIFPPSAGTTGNFRQDRKDQSLVLAGRLRAGVTLANVRSRLSVLSSRLEGQYPVENKDRYFLPAKLPRIAGGVRPSAQNQGTSTLPMLLLLVTGAVLLVVCLNLGNMMLARAESRRREIAIRTALGGGRARLLRQIFTEGIAISLLGGLLALLLTNWGFRCLLSSLRMIAPFYLVIPETPDGRVLLTTLGICVVSTLMFGLAPARRLLAVDVISGLKSDGDLSRTAAGRAFAPRKVFVIAQVALSMVFLAITGLLLQSNRNAARGEAGFPLDHGAFLELAPGQAGYDETRGRQLLLAVADRLGHLPGVASVTLAQSIPFSDEKRDTAVKTGSPAAVSSGAKDSSLESKPVWACHNVIGTDYFKTLGVPLLRGREFARGEIEQTNGARVAIIDDEIARGLWPREDALGRRLQIDRRTGDGNALVASSGSVEMEVVGIVPSLKMELYDKSPSPHIYEPLGQGYAPSMLVQVRHRFDGAAETAFLQTLRAQVRALDPDLPIVSLKTLRGHLETNPQLWLSRTWTQIFTLFGALALFLALVGVYGVNAYAVTRRFREIGIRLALGALRRDVWWLFIREGLRLTLIGIGLGLLLTIAVGRLISSWLYQVSAFDPFSFLVVPVALALATLVACWLPARRAAQIDPLIALRHE